MLTEQSSGPLKFSMIAVADLSGLKFLSQIRTEEEYLAQSNGPYLVGHIIDRETFTAPLAKAIALTGTPRASEMEEMELAQQTLLQEMTLIDRMLDFNGDIDFFDYDQHRAEPGQAQRPTSEVWHQDQGGEIQGSIWGRNKVSG